MTLVDLMKELQGEQTQEEFAALIGATQAMVSAILLGKRGIGRKTVQGLMRAFPERSDVIQSLFFLSQEDNN
jgi:predicted transcriptional regulator